MEGTLIFNTGTGVTVIELDVCRPWDAAKKEKRLDDKHDLVNRVFGYELLRTAKTYGN